MQGDCNALPEPDSGDMLVTVGPVWMPHLTGPKESLIPALITAFTSLTLKIMSYAGFRSTLA